MKKRGGDAWAISDRSGMRFKIRDMVIEPGTGYFVHKSESDGKYNQVDHPQAHLQKYAKLSGDPYPLKNTRVDINHVVDMFLTDEDSAFILDNNGLQIYGGQL